MVIDFIPQTPPLWQTQLAFDLGPSDTSATLAPELLTSGIPLPAGTLVCVSIDIGQPNPEYIVGTLTANILTFITRNVDPLDPTVSIGAFSSTHGQGAIVKITDFSTIQIMRNILQGITALQNVLISPVNAINPTDVPNFGQLTSAIIAGGLPATNLVMGIVRLAKLLPITLGICTITIASPAVITLANHGLTVNDIVTFSTTGSLPTGITAGASYYVLSTGLTTNTFEISSNPGGTAIDTSGSQSGTQTLIKTTPVVLVGNLNTNNALAGVGTPSSTNIFETENDTSNGATQTSTTISFTAPSTISDSGSGFVSSGFRAGDSISISGSASNNGNFTIVSVIAGTIIVAETSIVNEVAGASDTLATVTANKLIRYTNTSQIIIPVAPTGDSSAISKSFLDTELAPIITSLSSALSADPTISTFSYTIPLRGPSAASPLNTTLFQNGWTAGGDYLYLANSTGFGTGTSSAGGIANLQANNIQALIETLFQGSGSNLLYKFSDLKSFIITYKQKLQVAYGGTDIQGAGLCPVDTTIYTTQTSTLESVRIVIHGNIVYGVVADGSVNHNVVLSHAVLGSWNKFSIVFTPTSVTFYANGHPETPITTNIPVSSSDELFVIGTALQTAMCFGSEIFVSMEQ